MTAVISCPLCGGFEEEGLPEELRDAARRVVPFNDRNPWEIGIDVDQFCSQFAAAFSRSEEPPRLFRLGRGRWEYIQLPQARVADAIADLYRQLNIRVVATEDQLKSIMPASISTYRWWESVPQVRAFGSNHAVRTTLDDDADSISVLSLQPDRLPTQISLPPRIVVHVATWLDPVGILLLMDEGEPRIVRLDGDSPDGVLSSWAPTIREAPAVDPDVVTSGIEILKSNFDEAEILNAQSWLKHAHQTESIVWGRSRSGTPHVALEERASFLARAWRALEANDTWASLIAFEDADVANWLQSELENTRDNSDIESLADDSLYTLSRERLQESETEAWPWLNSEEEFVGYFESVLPSPVSAAVEDALKPVKSKEACR